MRKFFDVFFTLTLPLITLALLFLAAEPHLPCAPRDMELSCKEGK